MKSFGLRDIKFVEITKEDKIVGYQLFLPDGAVIDTYKEKMFCPDCFLVMELDEDDMNTVNNLVRDYEKIKEAVETLTK